MSEAKIDQADSAGVIIPPPTIYTSAVVLGLGLDHLWPIAMQETLPPRLIGFFLMAVSIILAVSAFREFGKARTNIRPDRPTSRIISTGPYHFTRNPLYLALAILHAGIGFVAENGWILLLLVPTLLIVSFYVIRREEAYLTRKFEEEYINYRNSVHRWL